MTPAQEAQVARVRVLEARAAQSEMVTASRWDAVREAVLDALAAGMSIRGLADELGWPKTRVGRLAQKDGEAPGEG